MSHVRLKSSLRWRPSAAALRIGLVAAACMLGISGAFAQQASTGPSVSEEGKPVGETQLEGEAQTAEDIGQKSLPLRTALHSDASLDAPFDRLLSMYRAAGQTSELIEIYRQHVASYPADANAAAVLVRLLMSSNDSQALATAQTMAARHKDHAYLQYLYFQALRQSGEGTTLAQLERAVALSKSPPQKAAWIELLLTEAAKSERPQLVDRYLQLLATEAKGPEGKLLVAQRMLRYGRHAAALALLDEAARLNPSPEVGVQIEMEAASAEIAADRAADAAARLDRLLAKLAPDYWNRAEIMRRRIALVTSEPERTAMIEAASRKVAARPKDEAASIDLAELLIGFERRREALGELLEAGRKIPTSEQIEKLTLMLLDRLRDERARQSYLAERIKAFPNRADLLSMQIKSLLLTGDRPAARQQLENLIKLAPAEDRVGIELELARSLVRGNLITDAADILERVVSDAPERFDVRRELAELYLKLGNRSRARELFAGQLPAELDIDQVLGFVPFLIKQEMFIEAQRALEKVIQPDDANLDVRLLLADVQRRTGSRSSADRTLTQARPLADTSAAYRQWLEAEATLHREDETLDAFIQAEQARLAAERGAWTDARTERVLALVEIGVREKSKLDPLELVSSYLDDDKVPQAARKRIREQLVRAMSSSPAHREALAEQLSELIEEQPGEADEYRARLALVDLANNDYPAATALIDEVRMGQLQDVELLHELEKVCGQLGRPEILISLLGRLTVVEPTNKANWEAWFYYLALAGREDKLRDGLRRLLAGIEGLTLEDSIRKLLQSRFINSFERSIQANISDGRQAPLADALAMLSTIESQASTPQQSLWICWVRAFVLNRLGRSRPRDESFQEMQRIFADLTHARQRAKADAKATLAKANATASADRADEDASAQSSAVELDEDELPWLHGSDGLTISMEHARRLLESGPSPPWPKADARLGPLPKLQMAWAVDFPADRPIERLMLGARHQLYLVDARGTLASVDAHSGKTSWEAESAVPQAGGRMIKVHANNIALSIQNTVQFKSGIEPPMIGPDDRIYFGHGGEVHCLSGDNGRLLWRSAISADSTAASADHLPLFVCMRQNEVIAYDPAADVVSGLDAQVGKLAWSLKLDRGKPLAEARPLHWLNVGYALNGHRMFVYGRRTAMIDLARREVEWVIEPEHVAKWPLRLDPPAWVKPLLGSSQPMGMGVSTLSARNYPHAVSPFGTAAPLGTRYVNAQQRSTKTLTPDATRQLPETKIVGPATMWSVSSLNGQPRFAFMNGGRLVLGSHDQMGILDTDLPVSSRAVSVVGNYLGCISHYACFLQPNQYVSVDLVTGVRGNYRLNEITGGKPNARIQAVIDGPLIYLAGRNGLLCLNNLAGKRVFFTGWPEGALLDDDDPRSPPAAEAVDESSQVIWNGMISPVGENAHCIPSVAAVDQGRLYVAVTPWRLVAIDGASAP